MPPPKDTAISDALNKNPKMSTILNPKTIDEMVTKFVTKTLPTISV